MFKKNRNMFERPDFLADFHELTRIDAMSREKTEANLRLLGLEINERLPPQFQRLLAKHTSSENAKPAALVASLKQFWPTLLAVPIVLLSGLSIFGWEVSGLSFVLSLIAGSLSVLATASVFQRLNKTNSPAPVMSAALVVASVGVLVAVVSLGTMSIRHASDSSSGSSMNIADARSVPGAPTVTGYTWGSTPTAGQLFNGTINGSNFVTGGTSVFFCVNGTSTCYQQPAAGANVSSSTSLTVSNVNLSAGSWQIYGQSSAGWPARSIAFTSQAAPPPISGYTWDRPPIGGQPFNGTISGANFVTGGTSVFFCVNGSSTCYQQQNSGVTVTNSSSLTVNNVNPSVGSWQIYVQPANGMSVRAIAFTLQAAEPTITSCSRTRPPTNGQPFNGTITGTNFVAGVTSAFVYLNDSSTCYQQPTAGVNVTSSTSLNLSNVRLSAGSWQVYVQTSAGQSARSTTFSVR